MSLQHLQPGDPVDLAPLGPALGQARSIALMRDDRLELMRLVLPAGKRVPEHVNAGPVTVQCLEGEVVLEQGGAATRLGPSQLAWVPANVPHSLLARTDCAVLVTIVCFPGGH